MILNETENLKTETNQKRPPGLVVLEETHDKYRRGKINYRQMILIAYADRFVNKYGYRSKQKDELGNETKPGKSWTLPLDEMAEELNFADRSMLKKTLKELKSKKLIDWDKPNPGRISVWTPEKRGEIESIRIAWDYYAAWQRGTISGPALILLSIISNFWWSDRECYFGDKWLGRKMGIKTNRGINKLLKELEDEKMIKRERREYQGKPYRYIVPGELIGHLPKKEKETQTGLAHDLAKQLVEQLREKKVIKGNPRLSRWQRQFQIILDDDTPEDELTGLIDWYCRVVGTGDMRKFRIPVVYQPGQFVEKYGNIVDAWERWKEGQPFDWDAYWEKGEAEHDEQSNGRKYGFSPELWAKFGNPPDEDDEKDKYVDEADGKYYLPDELPSDERDEEWEEFLAEYKKEKEPESKNSNGTPKHQESRLGNGNCAPRICVSRRVEG